MIRSITLLGSSSGRNAGDAALMSGIMDTVDAACGEKLLYEIPTIKPAFVDNNYANNVKAIPMLPWNLSVKMLGLPTYRSLMRTEMSLVFDAILFDRSLYNPLFNFLSSLALMMPAAKKRGKKMAFFNVGAGPVHTPAGRKMLRELSEQMDFITVRDQDSYDLLRDIGVRNPRMILTADAALNVQAAPRARAEQILRSAGLDPAQEILAINVNTYLDSWTAHKKKAMPREQFITAYANAINKVVDQGGMQLLFVVTQHDDVTLTREIMGRIRSKRPVGYVSNIDHSHYEVKAVLGAVSLLFAMRLHAMILASSELTPIIGLAYQPKCEYYFCELGLQERSMRFDGFSEGALANHMMKGWNDKAALRSRLEERIPWLKQEALKAAELVAGLKLGRDIDQILANYRQTTPTRQASGMR